MDRKKKRDKVAANGSIADGTAVQSGDAHGWQREAEQLVTAKRLASSATSDSPTQHGAAPAFNWSFGQHPSALAQQQLPSQTLIPQQMGAPQQQVQALQGALQGPPQSLTGWQNPDGFPQNASIALPPFRTGVGESSWPHGVAPVAPSLGGRPPPFPFLPPPYAGPWDPAAWWGHHPYPPPFPYFYPGYGGGYPCPMPPAPSVGANQRGIIKPPPGLSQKHIRIWESQSMENMQLWTTTTQLWAAVARSDAEITLQRTKLLKLEAELQLLKAHHDGNMPQSDVTALLHSGSKRGRRKKALPAPLAAPVSLPASESSALHAPGKRGRIISNKVDTPTSIKEMELEEKEKSALNMSELVYRPSITEHCDQKSCTLAVNPLRMETALHKHSLRPTLEYQSSTNNTSLTAVKDDLAYGHINHLNSPFKPNNLMSGRKENFVQSMKESAAASFLKAAGSLDHQGVIPGDMSYGVAMNGGVLCPEANGNLMVKDNIVRSQLQAHFNLHVVEKQVPHDLQKSWEYAGENGSDEQDEGGASVQDDDDGEDVDEEDDENGLDDMNSEKESSLWHSMPFR